MRTLVFPLSFLLLGLGFVGILIDGERRALHDVIAGTTVVYTWDALVRSGCVSWPTMTSRRCLRALPGPPVRETTVTQRQEAPAPDTSV